MSFGPCNPGCINWTQPISACVSAGCDLLRVKRQAESKAVADRFMLVAMRRCQDAVEEALRETAREFVEGV